MLRHLQARQLLHTARTQGSLRSGNLEIRISADFSKETADRRKAFLSFRTQLRRLDVKFGLFKPARMWITKNGESLNFYNLEDLRTFLEGLQDQTQSMETTARLPQATRGPPSGTGHPLSHTLSRVPDPRQWIAMEKLLLSAKEGLGGPYRDDLPSQASVVDPYIRVVIRTLNNKHELCREKLKNSDPDIQIDLLSRRLTTQAYTTTPIARLPT
ncbi:hypothetical protein NDU88_004500 [Pleurodeles waltl]|uniref:Uncharacterized protein n=1 Tax=Pleurodeles waltl TaxID=8319 RepID=A0AAV7RJS7_PLEWA|nr:hypothetical protein NDU88_004500 [Pleurodeles waltl]